jgi:hypothetical protein
MQLELVETASFPSPRSALWALLTDLDAMPLFTGFGPIPGIERVRWIEGSGYQQGAVREVRNRDGSTHREDVAEIRAQELLVDRIYDFTSPLRFIAREARDRFELGEQGGTTTLTRTFQLELTSALALPLAAALRPLLRAAIRRHHAALRSRLQRG